MQLPIRVAVVGASRGRTFAHIAGMLPDKVRLEAVCDINAPDLEEWVQRGLRTFDSYERLLEDTQIDAVCLATPLELHARQAIAALEAGRHVLSEVTAAYTLQECSALVAAAEASSAKYMMAENYCFMREVMMVQNMVDQGVFGDIIYAEGAYIHQIIDLLFDENDDLTWRGRLRRDYVGNTYPTHSLGPVSRWLGINKTDRYVNTSTFQSPSHMHSLYIGQRLPADSEHRKAVNRSPDAVTTLLRTEKGVLVDIRVDWASPRPHHTARYALQGTKASFTSNIDPALPPLIWIQGRSPEIDETRETVSWEPLWNYAPEYEHPWWAEFGGVASRTGHGGSDYFVLREFADAIIEDREPAINVYDAVTWSSITPLSQQSIAQGNNAVAVPRFESRPA